MVSANVLVEARRRANLTQRELAERAGVRQQEIARYERGRVTPSLERLRQLIAACGLELTFGLARADSSYDEAIASALAIPPAQRLARGLRDALAASAVSIEAHNTSTPAEVMSVLRTLERAVVRYVLIGELAEVLRGSPLLPISRTVTIVPRAGEHGTLSNAIAAGRGHKIPPTSSLIGDAVERWHLDAFHAEMVVVSAPAGTHGYQDLHRDATPLQIDDDGLSITVASLVDLVRIGEASNDRARMPALRRTLELTTDTASTTSTRAA
jgi:transcriptional regulator with XRE-family HTH domain